MKILLTGSNGFLGSYILKAIAGQNDIFTLNRSNSYFNIDLSNFNDRFSINFDCVIHCAGLAHLDKSINNFKELHVKNNVLATQNLLNALSGNIPKKFVYISSVSVYGLQSGQLINESYPRLANDSYGLSKIKCEDLVTSWCERHNVTCSILRLPLIVGENPPGNLGSMILGIKRKYYFNIDGGIAKKSMVHATDISKVILKISTIGGIYNLTDGINPNFYQLSHFIARKYGISTVPNMSLFVAKILAKLGDFMGPKFPLNSEKVEKITSDLTFDDTKARNSFGWNPTPVLDYFSTELL